MLRFLMSNLPFGTDDAAKSFQQPLQFQKAAFLPKPQFRGGTPASLVDWKDNGETTAPISAETC